MKKLFACFLICFICSFNTMAHASSCTYCRGHNHYRSSSCSTPVYLVRKDIDEKEEKFTNCDKHFLLTETTTNHYSDGTKRVYKNFTVFDTNRATLISNASYIKHTTYKNNHFFITKMNNSYKIINENGIEISRKKYTFMDEISQNKLLVKSDKKYGIIDLSENIIVPIKYKKFEKVGDNLFLTNLNGYYGFIDNSNNIIIRNEYDNIKPLYDTFLLKKFGKFGLANSTGEIVLPTEYDQTKKLGEYILVKKDKRFGVLDYSGNWIGEVKYKKIKLERNILKGKNEDNSWQNIPHTLNKQTI